MKLFSKARQIREDEDSITDQQKEMLLSNRRAAFKYFYALFAKEDVVGFRVMSKDGVLICHCFCQADYYDEISGSFGDEVNIELYSRVGERSVRNLKRG